MITNKNEYKEYVQADECALGLHNKNFVVKMMNPVWCYERALRKREYYENCRKGVLFKPLVLIAKYRHRKLGLKCGFSIPVNVCAKGLNIAHVGPIIVNPNAKIGEFCRLHVGVNIGTAAGFKDAAPVIGNSVYIGPGAKVFGRIIIADDIAIGANAVVNKSFETPGISIGGIPAKQISKKGSYGLLYNPKKDD